ncbi:hypothetical protein KAU43_05970 [candidate division WOR-3 bacterium]|nr:hypothetical protein [candidate division WOR-3 bacterium]
MNSKRIFFVLILSFILLPLLSMGMETKISMQLWNRYSMEFTSSSIGKSYFSLERGYLRIEPKFNDKIKGRFNLDFFSSSKDVHGVGVKLKYAYIDFKELLPVPESKIEVGLIKNYFGLIYDWNYPTIEKILEDKEKLVSSTDYGLSFNGLLPAGYGEYAISLINGEGYKKSGDNVNINPAYSGNLRLIPIPGITVGGSVLYERAGLLDTIVTDYYKRLNYALMSNIAFRGVDIFVEFLIQDKNSIKSRGFMIMTILKLGKMFRQSYDLDIVGRFDQWDKNINLSLDSHSRIICGLNYGFCKGLKGNPGLLVQLNWERTMFEDSAKPNNDKAMLQLRWAFSSKI